MNFLLRIELFTVAVLLTAGLLVVFSRRARLRVATLALVVAAAIGAAFTAHSLRGPAPPAEEDVLGRPIAMPSEGYAQSKTCRSCHPEQYATWHASYHPRMTQVAGPESVLGDFDDVELDLDGRTYKLERLGDTFWIEFDLPNSVAPVRPTGAPTALPMDLGGEVDRARRDGRERVRRPITLLTGSHHMQVYWYPTGKNRELGQFDFVWLREDDHPGEGRWVPRDSVFLQPKLNVDLQEVGRWNHTCIKCHTTFGQSRYSTLDSQVADFGIACEACHGPSEEHARRNRDPRRRYALHRDDVPAAEAADATVTDPRDLDKVRSSQVCGSCHGIHFLYGDALRRFLEDGPKYRPGDDLAALRQIAQPTQSLDALQPFIDLDPTTVGKSFWGDGTVRVSGREFNGLIDSPCFERGEMTCLSCHVMHPEDDSRPLAEWADDQLKAGMEEGNGACLQCHAKYADQETLTGHTHHSAASSGSSCYNCHMSYTTYGLLKAIRSHRILSPTVAESVEFGRPNACNQCHLDKTLAWTADSLARWYEQESPALDELQRAVPASLLWSLRGDAGQRALLAWSFGWEEAREASGWEWTPPFLAQLLVDPYDAVRYIAGRSLRRLPGYEDFEYDFVGPVDARRDAARRASEIWARRIRKDGSGIGADGRPTNAMALLVDPDGNLPADLFARLVRERDDRPVELAE